MKLRSFFYSHQRISTSIEYLRFMCTTNIREACFRERLILYQSIIPSLISTERSGFVSILWRITLVHNRWFVIIKYPLSGVLRSTIVNWTLSTAGPKNSINHNPISERYQSHNSPGPLSSFFLVPSLLTYSPSNKVTSFRSAVSILSSHSLVVQGTIYKANTVRHPTIKLHNVPLRFTSYLPLAFIFSLLSHRAPLRPVSNRPISTYTSRISYLRARLHRI